MEQLTVYPSYLWWVIPERLAGMPRPALENLSELYQAGLRDIVSLIDEPSLIMEDQIQTNLSTEIESYSIYEKKPIYSGRNWHFFPGFCWLWCYYC